MGEAVDLEHDGASRWYDELGPASREHVHTMINAAIEAAAKRVEKHLGSRTNGRTAKLIRGLKVQ